MVIVNIMGGLGNQMFQYAAARRLAILNKTELKLDASRFNRRTPNSTHTFQLDRFRITAPPATRCEVAMRRGRGLMRAFQVLTGARLYTETAGSAFRPDFLELGPDSYLIGYFNSYKYSEPIKPLLVDEFRPKEQPSEPAARMLAAIEDSHSVAVHIRRGDYVAEPNIRRELEGILTDSYYQNAMNLVASKVERPRFFLFSDDIAWVRQNVRVPGEAAYVDFNPPERGFEDLWLMSRCQHNIVAGGSTFSWWAACLNPNPDKIVVRTQKISNNPLYNHPEDYFPTDWKVVAS